MKHLILILVLWQANICLCRFSLCLNLLSFTPEGLCSTINFNDNYESIENVLSFPNGLT